jgi:lysophospholipase L1-like esterase
LLTLAFSCYASAQPAITFFAVAKSLSASLTVVPRRRIVSQFGGFGSINFAGSVVQSNGTTQLTGTDRFHWSPNCDCMNPSFVFINGYTDGALGGLCTINPNGNIVNFNMVVEEGSGLYPVHFPGYTDASMSPGGHTAITIGDGQMLESKPRQMGLLRAGSTQTFRVYHVVSKGEKWCYNLAAGYGGVNFINTSDPVNGISDTSGADYTLTYSKMGGAPRSSCYTFGPQVILGDQPPGHPVEVVMIAGDSIAFGYGSVPYEGYLGLALGDANIAFHNDGLSGVSLQNLSLYDEMGLFLAPYVDDIALNCGTNDFHNGEPLAQVQGYLEEYALSHCMQGANLHISTCLPRTSGAWSSPSGQSLPTWEATRIQWNNWLRDTTATGAKQMINAALTAEGCLGRVVQIIDPCLGVEVNAAGQSLTLSGSGPNQQSSTAGGYWGTLNGAPLTLDGTHPNPAGQAKAAAAVVTSASYWYAH